MSRGKIGARQGALRRGFGRDGFCGQNHHSEALHAKLSVSSVENIVSSFLPLDSITNPFNSKHYTKRVDCG
jgi:hypothetical protein